MDKNFRQILPVMIQEIYSQIIDVYIKSSDLWKYINIMRLTVNMRI